MSTIGGGGIKRKIGALCKSVVNTITGKAGITDYERITGRHRLLRSTHRQVRQHAT